MKKQAVSMAAYQAWDNNAPANPVPPNHDGDYAGFLTAVNTKFSVYTANKPALFTTDATGLFDLFMSKIDSRYHQVHNCRTCAKFFETYGGLVAVEDGGVRVSPMWDESINIPTFYKASVDAVRRAVERASITGVFITDEHRMGDAYTTDHRNPWKGWNHISTTLPTDMVYRGRNQTAFQVSAEKKQDFETMQRALQEFTLNAVEQAVTLLQSDSLYRSEKCLGVAVWLRDLMLELKGRRTQSKKDNLLWRAVAKAPAGFCHPRSSMIGTLLEDIMSGMDFAQVSKRFADKMDPTKYQRPVAPPKAGNIAQAEKVIQNMESQGSLRRRYARLGDLKLFWSPSSYSRQMHNTNGVFGHLNPKTQSMDAGTITMTWEKFRRQVLPNAAEIKMQVPSQGSFIGLATAVDQYSPPILQWDFDDERNQVSWYVYANGSQARSWNLTSHDFVRVQGITDQPSMWGRPIPNQGQSSIVVLEDCYDKRGVSSLCLFPEILKSEYHSIRSTIEAYSNSRKLEGINSGSAAGLRVETGKQLDHIFKVTEKNGKQMTYKIDRWD